MLTNNYSFNSPEKINQNDTIINDDGFITLINNLSQLIKTYYYLCKNNNDEMFQLLSLYESNYKVLITIISNLLQAAPPDSGNKEFLDVENHIKTISPKFHLNLEKNKENLNLFIEKAKELFKQMKNRRNEKLYISNNINKINNQMIKKKCEYSANIKNRNNM